MKILNKLLVLIAILCLALNGYGQDLNRVVSVNYEQQRIVDILADLGKRYDLKFSYSNSGIQADRKISVKVTARPLKQVLDELAARAGIQWQLMSGQIILKARRSSAAEVPQAEGLFQTVRGMVTDKESKVSLTGATIQLTSVLPVKATSTNSDGEFRLTQVPVGRNEVQVSAMGYQKAIVPILVNSGKELVLNIELTEAVTEMETVALTSKKDRQRSLNDLASVSARSFSVEETGRYAGGFFDPARMAQSFAGVTAGNDVSNDIVIRGNSSKGLQWRLEGVEIINPNHFGQEGSSSGGISMISSNMLANSDFFTGAFPAEYGNALSGVFDLQFRKGNTEKREYAVMAGILGTEVSMEGPFSRNGQSSYLVNYRYSTLAMLDKMGINPGFGDAIPIYQDLAFNLNFPAGKKNTLSVFGIGGISTQDQEADRDVDQWDEFEDRFDRRLSYKSGSAGIKHIGLLNDKVYLKNILSYSISDITERSDTLTNDYEANVFGRDHYKNAVLRYSGLLNYKANAKNTFRSGAILSGYFFDLNSLAFRRSLGQLSSVLDANGESLNAELFTQWKHRFGNKLSINTGVHASYFNMSSSWSVEPRLGLNWWVRPDQQFSLGAGVHSRLEPMAFYYGVNARPDGTVYLSNSKLSPTKALHLVAGYEKSFQNRMKLKAEAYYQHLFNVPVSSDPAINFSSLNTSDAYFIYSRNYRPLVNKGTGRNAGVELTLERSLDRGYYFLFTSSVFDSKFKPLNGQTLSTNYDSFYVGNFVAGKEWKTGKAGKNLFGINTKVVYTGGRRYSPINVQESMQLDEQVVDETRINALHAAPYSRIDFSMNYRINRPRVTHALFMDIQNLLNRQNEQGEFYNADKNKVEMMKLSGIIPTVNYRIEF